MTRVAITQSNYIPWKGYFDMINSVDVLVLYDDVQYTRRDWRNRNKLKTGIGPQWLTIPVVVKGKYFQKINEVKVQGTSWRLDHWNSFYHNYSKCEYFKDYSEMLKLALLEDDDISLSSINKKLINLVCTILGITTKIIDSSEFDLIEGKNERLVNLCKQIGADTYFSGPAAKSYIDENIFSNAGVEVSWMDYSDYPEYKQLYPPFCHEVTVWDLIFNAGLEAGHYMKSFKVK